MIFKVNQYFVPYLANGSDCIGESFTADEIEKCDKFAEKYLGHGFSVFELDSGEWLTDFGRCDICGEMSDIVYLYTEIGDVEEIARQLMIK